MLGAVGDEPAPHEAAAAVLKAAGYQGWVAVEMRAQDDVPASLSRAARFAIQTYGESA